MKKATVLFLTIFTVAILYSQSYEIDFAGTGTTGIRRVDFLFVVWRIRDYLIFDNYLAGVDLQSVPAIKSQNLHLYEVMPKLASTNIHVQNMPLFYIDIWMAIRSTLFNCHKSLLFPFLNSFIKVIEISEIHLFHYI